MELNYDNWTPDGVDREVGMTGPDGQRVRVRIHADRSYREQSRALAEVWLPATGWTEVAVLVPGFWALWGKSSPTQRAEADSAVEQAVFELMARTAATLGW